MKLIELFEAKDTENITVYFTDGTVVAVTNVPQSVIAKDNFEDILAKKIEAKYKGRTFERYTTEKEFTPTAEEKQDMKNVSGLYTFIKDQLAEHVFKDIKYNDDGIAISGGNSEMPSGIDYKYTDSSGAPKTLKDIKKTFGIEAYFNTVDPKKDEFGVINNTGFPRTMGDYVDLMQMCIDKLGIKTIVVAGAPQRATESGPMRIKIGGDSFQFKREIEMYKEKPNEV